MAKTKTLGRQLLATLRDVNKLRAATTDTDRREELKECRERLLDELGDLVDKNLDRASQEYKAATAGLTEASSMIRDTLEEMENVAKAISTIAKAIDLVSQVT